MGALMALDRFVVATGLLVLLGTTGVVAVARLATPAWRLNQRLERRAWRLLELAWWVTLLGTLAGLLLYGPFSTGLPPIGALDWRLLLEHTVRTRFGGAWALRILLCGFTHGFPAAKHHAGTGQAHFTAAPADRFGWYMTVLNDCG
jgi:hypothetical protein